MRRPSNVWLASGVRTPFAKVDGPLQKYDAIELSVPVARHMVGLLKGGRPDFAVWGAVVPSLQWSNIAREVLMDAGIDATTPAFTTVMACSTSMIGAIEATSTATRTISRWSAASTVSAASRSDWDKSS